ncbi:glucosamine inositolphosphorylceramide transferase family protein, partial [Thermomonas sp.]
GEWYMTVESASARRVSLYRATDFPLRWERTVDLVTGCVCVDGTLHHQNGHWYLLVNIAESGGGSCDELFLFVADQLTGPYRPHPANPVVCDVRRARPAGRLFVHEGRLIRPSQDCGPNYGAALVFNEVLQLDPEHYLERPLARLQPLESLGMSGCHTYSATPRMEVFDAHGRLSSGLPRIRVRDAAPVPCTPAGCAPMLSVIVASDREAEVIARSIESVLDQDFRDLEMIVATGVSDARFQGITDARLRILPGFVPLWAAALEQTGARSRYVARLSAGEVWTPGHALACVAALERDPQLGAVHAGGTPIIRRSAIETLEEAENPLAAETPEAQRELLARLSASSGMGVLELELVPSAGGDADAGIVAVTAAAGQRRAGVGAHYIHYSAANLLVLAAGFISFPILTRLLDNTQYGVLGYYEAWVGLVVAIAKLGTQHSVVRFYPFNGGAGRLEHFATNLLLVPVAISVALWGISALALGGYDVLTGRHFSPVFWCAFISIPLLVLGSVIEMVFRASERSLLLSVMRVVKRWLELLLVLGAVVLLQQTALAVYWGRLAAAALVLVYCIHWARKHLTFSRAALDVPAILNSWRYSMPLVVNEMAFIVLMSIDKVMLKYYSGGFAAVGIYTVGYSLAMQVSILMQATFYEAFTPVANRIHDVEGDAGVLALKRRVLMPMTYASIGVAAVILGVGQDALVALSGPTKSASGPVFVAIGMTMALNPLFDIAGYGLLLHKRSVAVLVTSMAAALTNIALNLLLIPRMGVMGAVTATISSYFLLGALRWVLCPVPLRCMPPAGPVARSGVCAILFVGAVSLLGTLGIVHPWPRLLVAGGLFGLLYALPLWLLDPELRQMFRRSGPGMQPA